MTVRSTRRAGRGAGRILAMAAVGLLFFVPLYWMVVTSLRYEGDILIIPPKLLPNPATADNYADLLRRFNFGLYFFNSLKVAALAVVGQLLSCSLGGYAFARLRFPLKRALFYLLLCTLMIPGQVTIIPTFVIFSALRLADTYVPLILPAFLGGAFGVFLLRQFFMSVPGELEEAARLDGCGHFRAYLYVFLPIAKPTLATLALFTFMNSWNDLLGPVIYLSDPKKRTITVALALFQDSLRVSRGAIMAGAVISIAPLMAVYLFAQRYFVAGMITSGFKE